MILVCTFLSIYVIVDLRAKRSGKDLFARFVFQVR